VSLVRRHSRPSVALIVLTWLILAGWRGVGHSGQQPAITLRHCPGHLGNAYIASGLIAAGMVFYIQRTESGPGAVASGLN